MTDLRGRHWAVALGLSAAVHAIVAMSLLAPGERGRAPGSGVSVTLGPAAAVALAVEAATARKITGHTEVLQTSPTGADADTLAPGETRTVAVPDASAGLEAPAAVRIEGVEPGRETPAAASAGAVAGVIETADPRQPAPETILSRPVEEAPAQPEPIAVIVAPATAVAVPAAAAPARPVARTAAPTRPGAVAVAIETGDAGPPAEAPSRPATGAGAGLPSEPVAAAAAGSGAGGYLAELATWLGRHKRYPSRARRSGQEGTVEVEFVIDREGRLLHRRIARSSGFPLLDEEAYALVARAAPMPPPPGQVASDRLSVTAPIAFTLR